MKKLLSAFSFLVLMGSILINISEAHQRTVKVPFLSGGVPNINGLYLAIKGDSTLRFQALPDTTVYVLERDGIYPLVNNIDNGSSASAAEPNGFYLYIKADTGTGLRPMLQPSPNASGGYSNPLTFRKSGTIENIVVDESEASGATGTRFINSFGGAEVRMIGCIIRYDRGAAVTITSDSGSVYLEDCIVHSCGQEFNWMDQGRVWEIRATGYVKGLTAVNCTFFNLNDRLIRNNGTPIGFVKLDHCTIYQTGGYHGGIQPSRTHSFQATNSIFYNMIAMGSRPADDSIAAGRPTDSNQLQPEKKMWVGCIDTVFSDAVIKIKNNNIFWENRYKALWSTRPDSVSPPGKFSPTLMRALGLDSVNASFADSLKFKVPPTPTYYSYIVAAFPGRGGVTTYPGNWFHGQLGQEETKDSLDFSYGTTARSYTAADNGLPVGDLNWYPAKKLIWRTTGVEQIPAQGVPITYSLGQNYPNPFNPVTNFTYQISKAGFVSVKIYDLLGREVATLVNEVKQAGSYPVVWNAASFGSGVYFCKMQSGSFVATKKMVLMK